MPNKRSLSTATELKHDIADGKLTAREVVDADIDRINALDPDVKAFAYFDVDYARKQADALDAQREDGRSPGALHGLTVGVKDIIDTADMPTENGTVLDAGRQPAKDATVVARLKRAGAVIMGKTVTAELANRGPGKTRNPHDPARTPGGSSSGSAAAVATGMVSLALGTQTGGSVIRPSSFCGVVGFKPSYGLIPRTGVLEQSFTLDTVGVHARTVADAALLAQTLCGDDGADRACSPRGAVDFAAIATSAPPSPLRIGFVRQAVWARADDDAQRAMLSFVESLGAACRDVPLSSEFDTAHDSHHAIHTAEIAKCYRGYMQRGRAQLSEALQAVMDEGAQVNAVDYQLALDHRSLLMCELDRHWRDFDVIITPAANGVAPLGLQSTGDAAFASMWTMLGVPTVSLPLLRGANDLPLGVQLVGRYGEDAALLRAANWFHRQFN